MQTTLDAKNQFVTQTDTQINRSSSTKKPPQKIRLKQIHKNQQLNLKKKSKFPHFTPKSN